MKRSPLTRTARKTFRCDGCSALFERRTDFKPRNPEGLYLCNACSRQQRAAQATGREMPARRTGTVGPCEQCGAETYRKASAMRSHRFCSRACQGRWQAENGFPRNMIGAADNTGTRNGRYKHGRRAGHHINRPATRRAVIERDGDWCLLCGKPPRGLHLHRVIYGSQGGKYELDNCVQLCGEHHALVHSDKPKWKPLLLEHIAHPESSELSKRSTA